TGALCQSGAFARACARNAASLGQSGQLRPGSKEAGAGRLAMFPKRFRAKASPGPAPGSIPVRVDYARQTKSPGSVLIRTEALAAYWLILNRRIRRRRPAAPWWSRAAGIAGSDGAVRAGRDARTDR